MPSTSRLAAGITVSVWIAAIAPGATLRVASWNMANHPNDSTDTANLQTILSFAGTGHAVDVLAMAETDTLSAPSTAATASGVFGGTYASIMTPADGGGDRTGFVYNPARVSLIASTVVGTGSITHPSMRAEFRPVGANGADDFYMYAVHLQSGDTMPIKNQRIAQAQFLRTDADSLGTSNVIFGGDFNWQKADDVSAGVGAYRTFNATGTGQLSDPVNQVGDWHANAAYLGVLSNAPATKMDDRFDMQLISGKLSDGRGLDYTAGSYHVLGNNGTYKLNSPITTGTGAPANVLSALSAFSDHLPVLADYGYRIPGDATGDDKVDFNDFLVLQNNFDKTGTTFDQGNFDYSAATDFNDFLILQNNFGASIAGTPAPVITAAQVATLNAWAAAIPEPTAIAMLAVAVLVPLRRRRHA